MAEGLNIEDIPNRVTAFSDNTLVYGGEPGGSGRVDATITKANFLKEDRARLTSNESNISTLQSDVDDLKEQFSFVRRIEDNASFEITQSDNSYLFMIGFLKTSTSTNPTVSVGTTSGGSDIISSREITSSERISITSNYELANNTIYFTVSGGQVSTTIIFMEDFFITE